MADTANSKVIDIKSASHQGLGKESRSRQDINIGKQASYDKALRLVTVLQSTLDVKNLIELFAHELKSLLNYDGVHYVNQIWSIEHLIGTSQRHRCVYTLKIDQVELGQITISMTSKFSDEDVLLMENIIANLIYPLRNALTYKQACLASMTDPLTGIPNRSALEKTIEKEIALSDRNKTPLSIIFADIDNFKIINDQYGHLVGDRVITSIASDMEQIIRATDFLARYGGDEFIFVLNNTARSGAVRLTERIKKSVSKINFVDDSRQQFKVTLSFGISPYIPGESIEQLIQRADRSMYVAKANGRDRVGLLG